MLLSSTEKVVETLGKMPPKKLALELQYCCCHCNRRRHGRNLREFLASPVRNYYSHEKRPEKPQQKLEVNSTGTHLQESISTAPQHRGRSGDIIVARERFVVAFETTLLRHFLPFFRNNGIASCSDAIASLSLQYPIVPEMIRHRYMYVAPFLIKRTVWC